MCVCVCACVCLLVLILPYCRTREIVIQFVALFISFFIFICNQDPFSMEVNRGPHGTKDNPRKVPSMFEERIVGCICEFQQAEAKTELG